MKTAPERGRLFILSGPSGVGKGTLRKALFNNLDGLVFSVSCTTRSPRRGETDGVDYRFISRDDFDARIKNGLFLEWAEVHGNRYGTLEEDVRTILKKGLDVVLEIDVQGALQVKRKMPEAVLVFVAPPSENDLRERLSHRGTEKGESLRTRLDNARRELEMASLYDHMIINDDIPKAVDQLVSVVKQYR